MQALHIELPDDVMAALRLAPDEMVRALRLAAAIHWYSRGVLSQERAAQIAELDRTDFLLALATEKVDAFPVDIADLAAEVARD